MKWLLALDFICVILVTILRINSFGLFNVIPEETSKALRRKSLPAILKHLVENQGLDLTGLAVALGVPGRIRSD